MRINNKGELIMSEYFNDVIYVESLIDVLVHDLNKEIEESEWKYAILVPINGSLTSFETIRHLFITLKGCGIDSTPFKPGPDADYKSISPENGALRITVPKESEIQIAWDDKDEKVPLCGATAAKLVKEIWVALIDKCFIRFEHKEPVFKPENLKVLYKETDKIGTYDQLNKLISRTDQIMTLFDAVSTVALDPDAKDKILYQTSELNKLVWFGIVPMFESSHDGILPIRVPETSVFRAPGRTESYAGEVAYEIAIGTIERTFGRSLESMGYKPEMVIEKGLHWDHEKYNEYYTQINSLQDRFSSMLEGVRNDFKDK